MIRDMETVRRILQIVEEHGTDTQWIVPTVEGKTKEEIAYHLKIMAEAGYVDATNLSTLNRVQWGVRGLTWEGHEFLDTIRNETVWARVKSAVVSKGGGASIEVVKDLAVQIAKQYFLGGQP